MGLTWTLIMWRLRQRENSTGARMRPLAPKEIGQIAGRAGRYMMTHLSASPRLASHSRMKPCAGWKAIVTTRCACCKWRNANLNFRSLTSLNDSLDMPPPNAAWRGRAPASDAVAPEDPVGGGWIKALAASRRYRRRLLDVCQLPDFRKLSTDSM